MKYGRYFFLCIGTKPVEQEIDVKNLDRYSGIIIRGASTLQLLEKKDPLLLKQIVKAAAGKDPVPLALQAGSPDVWDRPNVQKLGGPPHAVMVYVRPTHMYDPRRHGMVRAGNREGDRHHSALETRTMKSFLEDPQAYMMLHGRDEHRGVLHVSGGGKQGIQFSERGGDKEMDWEELQLILMENPEEFRGIVVEGGLAVEALRTAEGGLILESRSPRCSCPS